MLREIKYKVSIVMKMKCLFFLPLFFLNVSSAFAGGAPEPKPLPMLDGACVSANDRTPLRVETKTTLSSSTPGCNLLTTPFTYSDTEKSGFYGMTVDGCQPLEILITSRKYECIGGLPTLTAQTVEKATTKYRRNKGIELRRKEDYSLRWKELTPGEFVTELESLVYTIRQRKFSTVRDTKPVSDDSSMTSGTITYTPTTTAYVDVGLSGPTGNATSSYVRQCKIINATKTEPKKFEAGSAGVVSTVPVGDCAGYDTSEYWGLLERRD
jgi:hypothetical protein